MPRRQENGRAAEKGGDTSQKRWPTFSPYEHEGEGAKREAGGDDGGIDPEHTPAKFRRRKLDDPDLAHDVERQHRHPEQEAQREPWQDRVGRTDCRQNRRTEKGARQHRQRCAKPPGDDRDQGSAADEPDRRHRGGQADHRGGMPLQGENQRKERIGEPLRDGVD